MTDATPDVLAFLAARTNYPWPGGTNLQVARARPLYRAYVAAYDGPGKPLAEPQFFEAVRSIKTPHGRPMYPRYEDHAGTSYDGVLVETRLERARQAVISDLVNRHLKRTEDAPWRRSWSRHVDAEHGREWQSPDWSYKDCAHLAEAPDVAAGWRAQEAVSTDAMADGTVERLVEERFGSYLRETWSGFDGDQSEDLGEDRKPVW